jgi:hypothetical protein
MNDNLQPIIDTLDYATSFVPDEHKPNLHLASDELVRLAGEVERLKTIINKTGLGDDHPLAFGAFEGIDESVWTSFQEGIEQNRRIDNCEHGYQPDGVCPHCADYSAKIHVASLTARVEAAEKERRTAMLAIESLTPGGSEFVGDVERCVVHVRARQTALLDNIKRQVRLRVDLANERDVTSKSLPASRKRAKPTGVKSATAWAQSIIKQKRTMP